MKWNWQLAGWPKFTYDPKALQEEERRFLVEFGSSHASLKNVGEKEYYATLGSCNRSLDAREWVKFFAKAILQAQKDSMSLLQFLVKKSKLLSKLSGKLNPR